MESKNLDQGFLKFIRLWIAALFLILGSVLWVNQSQALINTDSLLHCTNDIRQQYGAGQLYMNEQLTQAARQKVRDMDRFNYWAHRNPITGQYAWTFLKKAGYEYEIAGENLAIGFSLGDHICQAWAESPTHFDNLINPRYQEVGFAKKRVDLGTEQGVLVVQLLGSRADFFAPDPQDYLAASLFNSEQQKMGALLFVIVTLFFCRLGIQVLRQLKEE